MVRTAAAEGQPVLALHRTSPAAHNSSTVRRLVRASCSVSRTWPSSWSLSVSGSDDVVSRTGATVLINRCTDQPRRAGWQGSELPAVGGRVRAVAEHDVLGLYRPGSCSPVQAPAGPSHQWLTTKRRTVRVLLVEDLADLTGHPDTLIAPNSGARGTRGSLRLFSRDAGPGAGRWRVDMGRRARFAIFGVIIVSLSVLAPATAVAGDIEYDFSFVFGTSTDRPVMGDWNGDGIDTPGVVRGNSWYLSNTYNGTVDRSFTYGIAGDVPVVGDWNGDGIDTPGV